MSRHPTDTKVAILWFKRDLRLVDHAALWQALELCEQQQAELLPLYVLEAEYWQQADASARQWRFIADCLRDLDYQLQQKCSALNFAQGDMLQTLQVLADNYQIVALCSHQETANGWTFQRDLAIKKWCAKQRVPWHETLQQPVKRAGLNRDHYAQLVQNFFQQETLPEPQQLPESRLHQGWQLPSRLDNPFIRPDSYIAGEQTQKGGRVLGLALLESFLQHREQNYLKTLAKPLGGAKFSSRLSPHIAWGSLSIREVMHATWDALPHKTYKRNLRAFNERLFWQSHFIQKLETEPDIEFLEMHPLLRDVRKWDEAAQQRYQAWANGQTGFPMVDACMRCLRLRGWLPFRMRAMLVSFASYQLWLPWQKFAPYLGALFTDYEPGIHYSQIQMQSGVTGINQMRVYNPVKQSQDQDPSGEFIRKWCPELAGLDESMIHQPWEFADDVLAQFGVKLGEDYPLPIVEHQQAAREAKQRLHSLRQTPEAKALKQVVFSKHGSRKRPNQRVSRARKPSEAAQRKALQKAHEQAQRDKQMVLF
ncbi:Deoxyribodipyrimidine photo-lyase [uncultured Thiomicrorhabdus sp.]